MTGVNTRPRLRDLGITIGRYPTGPYNAITDVAGVLVGHQTVIRDEPVMIRSGVTVILPRDGRPHEDYAFAGFHAFNGIGEMTGLALVEEWGLLTSPIVLTNTNHVGMAWDTISQYGAATYGGFVYKLPVVAETYDGILNDSHVYSLTPEDVFKAIENAASGPVAEGNVGGGTGMICYDFKGGIGTSSRVVEVSGETFTIGALVQANHGDRHNLRVDGAPVGLELNFQRIPGPFQSEGVESGAPAPGAESSSILVIIATDAPLLPLQCKRLARRATVGMARTGGVGYDFSGDLFLAFATGNHFDQAGKEPVNQQMLPHRMLDPLIEATAEAVEESILNALVAAETMHGYRGRTVYALPHDALVECVQKHRAGGALGKSGETARTSHTQADYRQGRDVPCMK